jgi:hypothetical protein
LFPAVPAGQLHSTPVKGLTGGKGMLLEGSAQGWGKIAECPVPGMALQAVAKWKGELWVGGGQLGLYKRVGTTSKLKNIKPNVKANSFDVREKLVIGCQDFIAETADGKSFSASGEDVLTEARDNKELGEDL